MSLHIRDEHHEVPETSSDERIHELDAWCWCRPEVVRIERDPDRTLTETQIVHRSPLPVEVTT